MANPTVRSLSRTAARWLLGAALPLAAACGDTPPADVVRHYAALVHANYVEVEAKAVALQTAIDALVATPSRERLIAARQAWLAARPSYAQSEVYRFYGGPIDNDEDGPEGRINAWPLDENYLDYVEGMPDAGIINDTATYPALSRDLLAELNEKGGEKNIATGYHAIEFLLWGQDRSATGPGDRPHTDYVTGSGGTARNQARRGEYLRLTAALLLEDLRRVRDAWAPGADNYGARFSADEPQRSLRRILTGMRVLSGAELPGERMTVAYEEQDQEHEHSCFSDNTHVDIVNNAIAIQNVYLGRYGALDGPGLDDLVRERDPALDHRMKAQLEASIAACRAIPAPFDQAILGKDDSPGRQRVLAAIQALKAQAETIVTVAERLGIAISLD